MSAWKQVVRYSLPNGTTPRTAAAGVARGAVRGAAKVLRRRVRPAVA